MMHGREKSDPAIVAKKPANNAGQPAAERVERRAGTEGNAGQQSTRRAQDRESVSQALERVRQAAKQRRKERFTALFHHINSAMLRTAFFALKRDAAAGVDGVTWQDYEADLDSVRVDFSSPEEADIFCTLFDGEAISPLGPRANPPPEPTRCPRHG